MVPSFGCMFPVPLDQGVAQLHAGIRLGRPTLPAQRDLDDACPMRDQRTSAPVQDTARRVLPLIDLTSLGDDDRSDTIDALCDAAQTPFGPVAAVCVWPRFVAQAVQRLGTDSIGVAAVANFPEGLADIDRATADARQIVDAGGTEVDVVFPWASLIAGDLDIGRELVVATREAVGPDIVLKVILETGELPTDELIRRAASDAIAGGADFLKTSTGKTSHSATPAAVRVLLEGLSRRRTLIGGGSVGLKVSGGVRTVAQAEEYLSLADEAMGSEWCSPQTFRFGASALLDDVLARLGVDDTGD